MSNNDLFSFIPTLITALAGLLTAIVGVFPILGTARKTQDKGVSAPSEHTSLEFLKMEHMPLDQAVWQILKKNSKLSAVGSFCFVMFITVGMISVILRFDLVPGSFSTEPLHLVLGSLSFVVLIINLVIYLYLFFFSFSFYINAGKQPEDARHHLFQETKIEVRADYKDVFSRCRETLQDISMQRMEYDFGAGALEADVNIGFRFFRGILRVKIDRLEDNRCLIHITLTPSSFKEIPSFISNGIWVVNQFIGQLGSY